MKTLFTTLLLLIGCKVSFAQFLIQASSPVDVCYPSTVTLSVVSPQAGYDYNWFLGGYGCPNTGPAGPYGFGTSIQAMITGEFYCLQTPQGGGTPQFSNPITVRVLPGMPGSIYMPAPGLSGNNTCVTSASLCFPAIYYQNWPNTIIRWYKNNVLISGAASGTYTATSEGYYKYTVSSSCVTALSDSTLVTTPPSATVTANGGTTVCSGSSVSLNSTTGIGYSYQWRKNLTNISGATVSSYLASSTGDYSVVVTSSCGTASSNTVTVTVNTSPSASITPSGNTTFCNGGSVVLNTPLQANRSYEWKRGGTLIPGAILSSYTATTGGNYRVIVTNIITGCSKTTANATVVTVNSLPAATITPQGSTTFCAGGNVVLQANMGTGLTYKWKKGNGYINGATLFSYSATLAGTYKVQVTNANSCSKTSAGTTVTVPCREDGSENIIVNSFDVNVYPNPSSGEFTVRNSNSLNGKSSVSVYDITGRIIFKEEVFPNKDNLTFGKDFLPGIYFAEITQNNNMKKIKIVKTK